jgi:hypothetical protein
MKKNQILNLVGFTFVLHGCTGTSLLMQSPNYILEKYDKFIGFKPISKEEELKTMYSFESERVKIWGTYSGDDKFRGYKDDFKKILNYLFFINGQPMMKGHENNRNYVSKYFDISDLIKYFSRFVGPVELISNHLYTHIHPLVKTNVIDKFIEKNQRDLNLYLTLNQ